jgi:N-hydroxyarylamine O-acetyltransferase
MSNDRNPSPEILSAYLSKIGFDRIPRPDLATLAEINLRHLEAFPYENFDVQLGRRVTRDPEAAFRKMVEQGRGGWCYEFNGLFAWMLEGIGFRVRYLAGAVMRKAAGDKMIGNHLVPVIELDRLYLADPSMGIIEPVPLVEGSIRQGFRRYALELAEDGWWRFHNHPGALPPSFDFSLEVSDAAILEAACVWLQSDPASPFVRNALVQKHSVDRMESLVGCIHTVISESGSQETELTSSEDYGHLVRTNFGAPVPQLEAIWDRVKRAPRTGFLAEADEPV